MEALEARVSTVESHVLRELQHFSEVIMRENNYFAARLQALNTHLEGSSWVGLLTCGSSTVQPSHPLKKSHFAVI